MKNPCKIGCGKWFTFEDNELGPYPLKCGVWKLVDKESNWNKMEYCPSCQRVKEVFEEIEETLQGRVSEWIENNEDNYAQDSFIRFDIAEKLKEMQNEKDL